MSDAVLGVITIRRGTAKHRIRRSRWLGTTAFAAAHIVVMQASAQTVTVNSGTTRTSNGATAGVALTAPGAVLDNSGTVTSATSTEAVVVTSGATTATINNKSGGTLSGTSSSTTAITVQSASSTLTLNNATGATIGGVGKAGKFYGSTNITNGGTISADQGMDFFNLGGSITNQVGGTISASNSGNSAIYASSVANGLSVTNNGTISVTGRYGIQMVGTGNGAATIVNNATISGGLLAMSLGDGNDTVTLNSASTTNGALLGDGNDTLNIVAGATITGDLDGSGGTDTLAFQGNGGATTITSRISNFESITKAGTGSFRLGNLATTAATIAISGGTLTLGGNPANWTGATSIAAGATLAYDVTTDTTTAASITGAGNFTKLGSNTLTLGSGAGWTGTTTVSAGTLTGTTDTLIGSSIVDNATLAYVQTASGSVGRQIGGTGLVTVSGLDASAAVSFDAAVTAAQGIQGRTNGRIAIGSGGSVDTSGAYSAVSLLQAGAALINAGSLSTTSSAATATIRVAVAATITNSGLIKLSGDGGGRAIDSGGALTLVNESTGRIVNDGTNIDPEDPSAVFTGAQLYLTNRGSITATGNGVVVYRTDNPATRMEMAGTIDNSGTINGGNAGILARAIADITNTGSVTGVAFGVNLNLEMEQASVVRNGDATHSAALIDATDYYGLGIYSAGALTVDNYGTIRGGWTGIQFSGGGTLTNRVGATIEGTNGNGIYSDYIALDVQSSGTIRSVGHAISYFAGGNLTNSGSVTSSAGDGVRFEGAGITLTNSGTITGVLAGIHALTGTTLTNATGGRIENTDAAGSMGAVHLERGAGALTLVNAAGATISGAAKAALFYDQADLDNSGTITSQQGVDFFDVQGTVTNHAGGVIESLNTGNSTIFGYDLANGLSVTNAGTIRSAKYAIETTAGSGSATIVNSGTITGVGTAIHLGNAADTVTLSDGSSIIGGIALGGGTDRLTITTGTAAAPTGISVTGALDGGDGTGDALTFSGTAGTIALAGNLSGFETITKSGANLLRLTGGALGSTAIAANGGTIAFLNTSGSNRIEVNGATLVAESGGAFGSGGLHLVNGTLRYAASGSYANALFLDTAGGTATLSADSGITATLSGAMTRSAGTTAQSVTIGGAGTILLSGSGNRWTGTTTIAAGATLRAASAALSGAAIANSGALVFDQATDASFTASIGGIGSLTKLGAGTLTLGGTGSWTGRTIVSAGTLAGSTISLSSASPITVNASLAYLQSGSGTVSNAIDGSGGVTVSGVSSGNTVSFVGTVTAAGGITGGTDGRITIGSGGSVSTTGTAAILLSGTGASLTNGGTIGSTMAEAVRITSDGASVTNAAGHSITSSQSVGVFALSANTSVDNSGSITGATGSYGVQAYGSGTVINRAGGTITGGVAIGGFAGMTIVNQGTLTATNAGPYNAAINITGGVDTVTLAAGSTTTGFVELWGGNDTQTLTGGSGASATTTVTGYVSGGDGTDLLTFDGSGTGTLTGNIIGFETIGKSGSGTWTIRDATAISSPVSIVGGTLALDSATGLANQFSINGGTLHALTAGATGSGTIRMADGTVAFGQTGAYANAILLDATGSAGTIRFAADSGTTATLSGAITRGSGIAAQAVTIGGSGEISLSSSANRWSGATTIAAGATLRGSASTISGGSIVDDGALVFVQDGYRTMSIPISGSGTVTKSGSGTLVLSGAGTWTGTTTISGGTLIGKTTSLGGASIVNNATLTFNQTSDGATSQTISGTGSLTKTGAGNLTLSGAGSWTGITTVSTGTLTGTSATIAGRQIVNNASLVFDQATDGTFAQAITGTGTLTKTGSGILTLTGATLSSGTTQVADGTLRLSSSNMLSDASAVTVTGGTLDLQSYSDTIASLALAGTLAGTGTLTAATYTLNGATVNARLGTGTLTQASGVSVLTGYSQSQVVDITGGTLRLGASDVLSDTATLTVRAGATLDLQNFSDAVGAFTIFGTLTGTGTLTADAYHLSGGTANLALGGGRMYVDDGVNLLNATAGATTVAIGTATLRLGESDRLSNNADVTIAAAGTLDIQGYSDAVRSLTASGAVTGTGTLSADTYTLQGASIGANLGSGTLTQASGASTLTGTSAAGTVSIAAGTLTLGGDDRLASGTALSVANGATLDLGSYRQTASATVDNAGTIRSGMLTLAGGTLLTRNGASTASVSSSGTSSIVTAAGGAVGDISVTGGSAVFDNYGSSTSVASTVGAVDMRLYAGSTTGAITLGSGDDRLALYTGVTGAGAAMSGAVTLREAGDFAGAQVGTIDLGGGSNTLDLRGDTNGVLASGAVGITTLTKRDMGSWTVTDLVATTVNVGTGTAGAGMLTLAGTGTIGTIRIDGATLTLASTTAAGSATLRMIDPTVDFAAVGTYANAIDLAVAAPNLATDPSIFGNRSGGAITLSGAIIESIAGQNVRFTGAGTTTLVGGNTWSGSTTIDAGTSLIGTTTSIGGSTLINAGTLTYEQSGDGTVAAQIDGAGSLIKSGAGTVTLVAANGLSGAVSVTGGGLRLANAAALANAASVTLTGSGTTLIADAGAWVTIAALSGDAGTRIHLASGGLSMINSADATFAGILSGNGADGFDKGGAGRLILSGANSLTTDVSVSAGTLALLGDGSLATARGVSLTASGATFDVSGVNPDTATVQILNGVGGSTVALGGKTLIVGGGSFAGTFAGTGGLTKVGGGTLTVTGTNAYGGATHVSGGTLVVAGTTFLPATTDMIVEAAGTLAFGGNSVTVNTLTSAGTVDGTATLTATAVASNGANYTLQGGTVNANLGLGLLRVEQGTTLLFGRSDATGVTIASGTLRLGGADRLSDGAAVRVASGATLDMQAYGDTVTTLSLAGALVGTGTLTASAYTLDNATVAGRLGTGTLTQASGVSTLTGSADATLLDVAGGILRLGASNVLADEAVLTVRTGATIDLQGNSDRVGSVILAGTLVGTGTLTAATYTLNSANVSGALGSGTLIQQSGSSILAGTSSAGTVTTVGGSLRLAASDRLSDSAAVSIDGGTTLDLGAFDDTVGTVTIAGGVTGTGTLTAATYALDSAAVVANLGTGTLVQRSGLSTLTGSSAASVVTVAGGTLNLGASDRLADTAALSIGSGATFDLGGFSDTVGTVAIAGSLTGAGTLTAATYALDGAAVVANLGTGTLVQRSGLSTLTGSSAASVVTVAGGTLNLGASDRLADTAALSIGSGAVLSLGSFSDTVGTVTIAGGVTGTGTLTAATYALDGAAVVANLGTGTLVQRSGLSTLTGSSAASVVTVAGGTLNLGASDRLADTAALSIGSGATFDLGGFSNTVGTAAIAGRLSGTGVLTAGQYILSGASVQANLGTGTLVQSDGLSRLSGQTAASRVVILGGTLALGADERLSDRSTVSIDANGTLDATDLTESIATLGDGPNGGGTVATGTRGRLTLGGSGTDSAFTGRFVGSGDIDKVGSGTFVYAPGQGMTTARLNVLGGTLQFAGETAGAMRVTGGTLTGGGTIGSALTLEAGTLSPGTTMQALGVLQASSLTVTGGTLVFDVAGGAGAYASDRIRVVGAAALGGGEVMVRSIATGADDLVSRFYTVVQAGSLTGSFANGGTLGSVSNDPALRWRLRYDLVPGSALIEVRKQVDFTAALSDGGTGSQQAVAAALGGAGFTASDAYANALNRIASGTPGQRAATFDSLSGEAIGNISTVSAAAVTGFAGLLQQRIATQGGFGTIGAAIWRGDGRPFNAIERLWSANRANGLSAAIENRADAGLAVWFVGYGSDGRIAARDGAASVRQFNTGQGMGSELRSGPVSFGLAWGINQIESTASARLSRSEGTIHQFGAYAGFDDGLSYASVTASYFAGDIRSQRTVVVNADVLGRANGKAGTHGYSLGGSAGRRIGLGGNLAVTPQVSGGVTSVIRDGFTEEGAGVLSLAVGRERRDLYQVSGQIRLAYRGVSGSGWVEPFVATGVRHIWGERDATSAMRFSGAPIGAGDFTIRGAELPPVVGLLGGGLNARLARWAMIDLNAEHSISRRQKEGRININARIDF
ncbi:autotransporter-associated beta strand repeat-containing protein [Sphingomonas sp. Leaf21]|uniref:autotransporter-associated beta strand repeat-containing protein n=1 Tax=Sphingomonas sp. Leaf21 TaxID=2876550 RepID=UPI001E62D030|nr:autotransporter-associated beta strand repeat-containing protein [Sphingomonas sp. Leaf21]